MEYARIYKMNSSNGLVYYGSTTQKYLSTRLAKHKCDVKKGECRSHLLFTEGATVTITLVENVENCKDKYELQARERWYIENSDCVNKNIPTRTEKEWREENKEYLKEWFKENYKVNREQFLEKGKEYREANREQITEYLKEWYKKNKEKQNKKTREYYEKNKEHISQQQKKYREANKDKETAWKREKVKCECGCEVARRDIAKHRRTQKHQNKMLELNKDVVATDDAGSVSPPSHICGEV
jgi:hypothetical protein